MSSNAIAMPVKLPFMSCSLAYILTPCRPVIWHSMTSLNAWPCSTASDHHGASAWLYVMVRCTMPMTAPYLLMIAMLPYMLSPCSLM